MRALARTGWEIAEPVPRGEPVVDAAEGVDVLAITTPDGVIDEVAARVRPVSETLVVHCSAALTLAALAPHERRASLHPLVPLPSAELGSERLVGAWFAVAGDAGVQDVVAALRGKPIEVADAHRAEYHAAAAIASNHVVALLGQVQRVALRVHVPLEAYLDLARASIESVAELGPVSAITGPIQRGDWGTVASHLEALDPSERAAYEVMAHEVARLVRAQEGVGA